MTNHPSSLQQWLLRPYPLWRGAWPELRLILVVSVLATALILVTRPFGLSGLPTPQATTLVLQLALASAVTGALLRVVFPGLLQRWWDESRWTVAHELVWACVEIALLAAALMAVLSYRGYVTPTLAQASIFLGVTALCASIPIGIRTLLAERWLRERHQAQIENLPPPAPAAATSSPACAMPLQLMVQDAIFDLLPGTLRHVRADENYVTVVWVQDGKRQERLLRAPLSDIERQLVDQAVVRCHRSYLVSLPAIAGVSGNAQGYRLRLKGIDDRVPVSRARAPQFLQHLQRWRLAAGAAGSESLDQR